MNELITKETSHNLVLLVLFSVILFILSGVTYGQRWKLRRYDIGVGTGTSQIFGDIGGTASPENWMGLKDIKFSETRPSLSFNARYKHSQRISIRSDLILGFGHGSDATSGLLRQREYNATFVEFSGNLEYYFVREIRPYRSHAGFRRYGMLNNYNTFAFYGFVGAGITYSYSTHSYLNVWKPRDLYKSGSNFVPVLPIGIGVKYIIDDHWLLDGKLGYRYALNDFVEGYTQTLDSKYNDIYYIISISLVYRLKTTRRNIPAIIDRHYRKMF